MRINTQALAGRAMATLCLGASLPALAAPSTAHYRNVLDVAEDQPELLCNDGTVPIFYVHEGTTEPNRWVIYFEGGSSCQSPDDCEDRFDADTRAKMGSGCYFSGSGVTCGQSIGAFDPSGGLTPPGPVKSFNGLLVDTDPATPAAAVQPYDGWTHVYLDYCSSDTWSGQGGVMPTEEAGFTFSDFFEQLDISPAPTGWPPAWTALSPWGTGAFENVWITDQHAGAWANTPYAWTFHEDAIFFNGHNIVAAVLEQLGSGTLVVGVDTVNPDLSIHDAVEVLVAGSSAGGVGARTNLDFIADWIATVAPTAEVSGLIEAAYTGGSHPDIPTWPALSESVVGDWEGSPSRTLIWNAFIDQSCAARLPDVWQDFPYEASADYMRCGEIGELITGDDLETPYFARHALWDAVTRPATGAAGTTGATARKRAQQQYIEYGGWHITQESQLGGFYFDCDTTHVQLPFAAFYNEALDTTGLSGSSDTFAETVGRWRGGAPGAHRASMACNP